MKQEGVLSVEPVSPLDLRTDVRLPGPGGRAVGEAAAGGAPPHPEAAAAPEAAAHQRVPEAA